jgi:hypothetical protein
VNGQPIDLTSDAENSDGEQQDGEAPSEAQQRRSSLPPSSASEPDLNDDWDIDTMIAQEEARLSELKSANANLAAASATPTTAPIADSSKSAAVEDDGDDAIWAEFDRMEAEQASGLNTGDGAQTSKPATASSGDDLDDEDMWEAMREAESVTTAPSTGSKAEVRPTSGEADDEAMWDVWDEVDAPTGTASKPVETVKETGNAASTTAPTVSEEDDRPTNSYGWEDMYAD